MRKLNKKLSLAVFYVLFTLFVSGCSNKVNLEHKTVNDEAKSSVVEEQQQETTQDIVEQTRQPSYINETVNIVNGKKIVLKSIHFPFDKFTLSDEMRKIAKENYAKINPLVLDNDSLKIQLEGNCDEWGSDEYNYALGLKRAKAVKDTLINDGIPSDRIKLVTFGESNPLCNDRTLECWKKNRRTDYKLLP
jgi:peptidoglycan-associated lipoprotein